MLSNKQNSAREKNSGREGEGLELTINLAVHGSPAPIYVERVKTSREHKNTKYVVKDQRKRKEFPFPVDKIVYLARKLELTSLTEKKLESVALSAVDVQGELEGEVFGRGGTAGREVLPSDIDLSLDLSSISNADEDSDDSEEEKSFRSDGKPQGTCRANVSTPRSPFDECETPNGETPASNCDLTRIYVNSVENQKDLLRYFRPCRSCSEPCCICSTGQETSRTAGRESCGLGKANKGVETEARITGFECRSFPAATPTFRDCGFCWLEFPCGEDCACRCSCRIDETPRSSSDDSVGSDLMRSHTSSLAKAARSARALVRDLELILRTLPGDVE